MIECSLFSVKKSVGELQRYLESHRWHRSVIEDVETVYISTNSKIYFRESRSKFVQKSMYDYNKERVCICCVTTESTLIGCDDTDAFLAIVGFRKEKVLNIRGFCYTNGVVHIEMLQVKACPVLDNRENGQPVGAEGKDDDGWLLRLYAVAEQVSEGERTVVETKDALKQHAAFVKPPVEWFNTSFVARPA